MSQARANRRGIFALIAGMGAYNANDAFIKLAALNLPTGQAIFVRGLFTFLILAVAVVAFGYLRQIRATISKIVLLRAFFETIATFAFINTLMKMPLAEAIGVTLLAPLFITAMSVFIDHEQVGWRRWSAVLVGFAGALLIIKPIPSAFNPWALLGVAAAFFSAGRDLLTRRLDPAAPALVVTLISMFGVLIAALGFRAIEDWQPLRSEEFGLLFGAGLFLGIGTYLVVVAYRGVEISVVSPFRYSLFLWSVLIGFVAFRELPDLWAACGVLLIIGSGLYTLHRERIRGRPLKAGR